MRSREGLVNVVVHHVAAEVAGASLPEDRVHVGPVDINETACTMQHFSHLCDVAFEQTQCVRVRHHEHRSTLIQL